MPSYAIRVSNLSKKYYLGQRYGSTFRRTMRILGITEVISARQSPWQNPFVERVIGSIRRECTDHIISLGERHLVRVLRCYATYYNESRAHLSLDRNSPSPGDVPTPGEMKEAARVAWLMRSNPSTQE